MEAIPCHCHSDPRMWDLHLLEDGGQPIPSLAATCAPQVKVPGTGCEPSSARLALPLSHSGGQLSLHP